jgi:hypothetical protein
MPLQKINYLFFLFFIFNSLIYPQSKFFIVTKSGIEMKSGPGVNYTTILTLAEGDVITLTEKNNDWSKIVFKDTSGYILSEFISEINLDDFLGWEKILLSNGDRPGCFNFTTEMDSTIDNFLKINVGSNTDVVIKLMNYNKDKCIRYIYIKSSETYFIRNIPQGVYYLKIAYGKDWKQKTEDGQCVGKFMINPQYEKGNELLDYNFIETTEGYQVPNYELSLDVIYSDGNAFKTDNISESEFNR